MTPLILSAFSLLLATSADAKLTHSALVERYRTGDREAAVREVASWPRPRLQQQVGRIQWHVQRGEAPGVSLTAAIMLHTDAAVLTREQQRPFASDLQLDAARTLVGLLQADPKQASFARRWYLAVAAYEQGLWDAGRARRLLDEARRRFPQDVEILVALGSVSEMEGSLPAPEPPAAAVARPGGIMARIYDASVVDRQAVLRKAEETYRQAIALEPALPEGRLRRGEVRARLGQRDEALAELGWALQNAPDDRTRYLARLFTGRVLEAEDRLEEAATAYRAAIEVASRCQAGRLALGRVLDRLRSRESATEVLLQAVAVDEGQGPRHDPWWTYPFGAASGYEPMLAQLRQEARS